MYVDDVFLWRDDYPIYDDMNYFVWTKPEQKNINFIDRLAYHHFMMWVGDTDFEIKSIEGQSDDFKVELEDGHDTWYSDPALYLHYCRQDVRLLPKIDEAVNALNYYTSLQQK